MILLIAAAVVGLSAAAVLMFLNVKGRRGTSSSAVEKLQEELNTRAKYKTDLESIYDNMVDLGSVRKIVHEVKVLQEALKAERGRITITEAEVETVEQRFRELEEIERELEASNLETKNEYGILKKKEGELSEKNATLSTQLGALGAEADKHLAEMTLGAEEKTKVANMKTDLNEAITNITNLLQQIGAGNEQYLVMKTRYDALDIEYAQLYEKFSVANEESSDDDKK